MRADELDYPLPEHLIARHPTAERDGARLLVVAQDGLEHGHFTDLERMLEPGTLLVANDTRVMPARLFGTKAASGGKVELLLVQRLEAGSEQTAPAGELWSAMARSSRPLKLGSTVLLGETLLGETLLGETLLGETLLGETSLGETLRAKVVKVADEQGLVQLLLYAASQTPGRVANLLQEHGHMPLPPYLRRAAEPSDTERYQTVFARVAGAVAAPTAGLHFSEALLSRLRSGRVELATITLHVGPGTFRPVSSEHLGEHPMHTERYEVPEATASCIAQARRRGHPVVAIGTTVVRALEAAALASGSGRLEACEGQTALLIQPGFRFKVVDGLITNFHLPRSTLLALVYAFGGAERLRAAYRAAVRASYRFFSYGDAMYLPSAAQPRSSEAPA